MKEPVDHIIRPRLPWRSPSDPAITECGYDASKVKAITREQFLQRWKDLGQQRTALLTCMTCSDTARRWGTWEDDPRKALEREITWEGGHYWNRTNRGTRLRDELTVLAGLAEAHRDDFLAAVAAIEERRDWNAKKDALKKRPAQPKPRSL